MKFRMSTAIIPALALAATGFSVSGGMSGPAMASDHEAFPEDDIFVVVPWGTGGRTDVAVRIWAPYLQDVLDNTVVVDNRAGGGGIVGAADVADADPDGHTIGVFSITHVLSQWTSMPPFEMDNYIPIALPYSSPFVLVVDAEGPYESLDAFLEAGMDDVVSFGNSGTGTSVHVAAAAFADAAGINGRFIPYEGDAGAVQAVLGGEVDGAMVPMVAAASQVDSGALRVLGVSLAERDDLHEGIPTFSEQGVDFVLSGMGGGLYAPAGTPASIIETWEGALAETFENEDLIDDLGSMYISVDFQGSAAFAAMLDEWNPILEDLVDSLDLRVE